MSKSKLFAAAALVTAGVFGVGVAQAYENTVSWSVVIGSPMHTHPMPVVRPTPVIVQPAAFYASHRYQQPTRWDRDGDGIANRHDRLYNPVWDRDGDGIPNQRDRFDNRRNDRDGDGIANRYDRH